MWQKFMIYLAQNKSLKNFFQTRKKLSELATKFVGGQTEMDVIKKTMQLMDKNIHASLFYLGEYVNTLEVVDKTVVSLRRISRLLAQNNLDVHISVDPTQIGLQIDTEICAKNLQKIASQIKKDTTKNLIKNTCFLMIDMEDYSVYHQTINYYKLLIEKKLPVALTLQAYLFESEQDLTTIINMGGVVRLVKGAFSENKKVAYTLKKNIKDAYFRLSKLMLSPQAKKTGFYPIFATHNEDMIKKINVYAHNNQWHKNEYEFEMLYGVRVDYQQKLVEKGYKVRVYLPYGEDWWSYALRRVGENPKNIKFLIKN